MVVSAPEGPAIAHGTSVHTDGSLWWAARASMIPARSAGANPVRTASASWGEVSQVTSVMPMPPRSIAEISSASA